MTLADWVGKVEQRLLDAELFFGHGTDNAFDEAVWLVMFAVGNDVGADHIDWQQQLDSRHQAAIEALLRKRITTRRPLAYLVNQAWLAGYEFYIDERAIVPRSHLGEWIPERFQSVFLDHPRAVNRETAFHYGIPLPFRQPEPFSPP